MASSSSSTTNMSKTANKNNAKKMKEKDAQSVSTYGSGGTRTTASSTGSKNPVKRLFKILGGGGKKQRNGKKNNHFGEGMLEKAVSAKAHAKAPATKITSSNKAISEVKTTAKGYVVKVKKSLTTTPTPTISPSAFITNLSEALTKVEESFKTDFKSVNQMTNEYFKKIADNESIKKISPPLWHRVRTSNHQTVFKREDDGVTQLDAVTSLGPDEVMDRYMTVVSTKHVDNLTVSTLYEQCFRAPDFYEQWLTNDAKTNINVSDWEMGNFQYPKPSPSSKPITHEDDQTYTQRRTITYTFNRDPKCLGYHLGKPQVDCTQTMYYKQLDDRRAIIAICMDTAGDVCSDCFRIHIRGVITMAGAKKKDGDDDQKGSTTSLLVDFGVNTEFVKRTLLSKYIRGIVEDATRNSILTLFDMILQRCDGAVETARSVDALEPAVDPYYDNDDNVKSDENCCFSLFGC